MTDEVTRERTLRLYACRSAYDGLLGELDYLAALWLEKRASGKPTDEIDAAIDHANKESRKYEKKIRKLEKQLGLR